MQYHTALRNALCAALLAKAFAFSASSITRQAFSTKSRNGITVLNLRVESDDADLALMLAARECAHSDSCSVDEAEDYLQRVVAVQSGCGGGLVVTADACEDPVFAAEIIGDLRRKITAGVQASGETILSSATKRTAKDMVPAFGALVAMCWTAYQWNAYRGGGAVVPLTAQEWLWAMKGGYLDVMIAHFLRNGGL